ncbi:uncharacterized protein [Physcomitrium patens]|uniref:BHLH domain-containing protein n=1 Tax=Physcomitrium patens TaxID=3218 RepID=A0A2K1LBM0_PHYPA|nr:uncharacterized protein LOC112279736 [Physcomitrium patens]PNR63423.1 hypothetical protein PHYPA_001849 [Physcomitrium patens]|eukprot:XP_024370203.1 uncharacterized protein LOC112279736 [Physcomitrella patens]
MSQSLRANDCSEFPDMEVWLNARTKWSENHDVHAESSVSVPLSFHSDETLITGAGSLFEDSRKEDVTLRPFLKLETMGLCVENQNARLLSARSAGMVDSSCNEEDISEQASSVALSVIPSGTVSAADFLDQAPRVDEVANLYMEADSPHGLLFSTGLQLETTSRTASHKRVLDDSSEASCMQVADVQSQSRKSPKVQHGPVLLQDDGLQVPVDYVPFVAMAKPSQAHFAISTSATFLPTSPGNVVPAVLFPTPLTLPNVPSMEEIAQTRPKRRNVRISSDPQSVAARHRRERISDRVRVLQHFVPGGTKMDTASMLDEAIHYVKFLQQQLQAMERISRGGSVMMPEVGYNYNAGRVLDLDYGSHETHPSKSMAPPASQQSVPTRLDKTWATNPLHSQGLRDPVLQQFCH